MNRVSFSALLCALIVVASGVAHSHGRFPEAGSITVDPNDSSRLFVRATYGVVTTVDAGATWYWLCPEAVGFNGDKEDPPIVMTDKGAIVAGTFRGPSVARGDLCDFAVPSGDAEGRFFVDVALEDDLTRIVGLSSNGVTSETFDVNLWESTDEGATWSTFGTQPPENFLAVSFGLAPTNPARLYVSGRDGNLDGRGGSGGSGGASGAGYRGALYRSENAGQSWERFDVPGTDDGGNTLPYVGAVSPNNPDRIYVATIRQEDGTITDYALLFSDDGGGSWITAHTAAGNLPGFALSPDGTRVAIAGKDDGLLIADATSMSFEQVSELHISCVTWVNDAMFVCTDQFRDGYSVARSTDDGNTFEGIMQLDSPCGPPECPSTTSVGAECPSRWPQEKAELGGTECGGARVDPPAPSNSGCGCALPSGEAAHWPLAALVALAMWRRGRRRSTER